MKIDMSLLRTYHYISTRKIIQLGNEIQPSGWSKLRGMIKAVKLSAPGNGGVGVELNLPPDPNTLLALRKVVDKLGKQKRRSLGTLDEDMPFVYGTIDMYRQVFTYSIGDQVTDEPVFVTVGATERTIVALGASVRGLGATGSEGSGKKYPFFPEQDVMAALMKADDRPARPQGFVDPFEFVAYTYQNWIFNRAGKIKYEVLAQRESRRRVGPPFEVDVLIGSPVFLALA